LLPGHYKRKRTAVEKFKRSCPMVLRDEAGNYLRCKGTPANLGNPSEALGLLQVRIGEKALCLRARLVKIFKYGCHVGA
jgi:hypothetical protein